MGGGDQRGQRGSPRFNGATCLLQDSGREQKTHPPTCRVQATVISSWRREQAQPSSSPRPPLLPLLSPAVVLTLLPYNSAQPSPAQPEAEAELLLQLMH